ncbi:MAG: STAS domain-containing protein [Alphaproteobacteria bacterium]|nr:STAS domain-containing protein [Alphaproteobacteria bacterium]MBU2378756.1 STAS domain-containing protein [Alphaproteobacteria bacterium]
MTAAHLVLPPVLDIQNAEPLRAELLTLRGRPVTIDGSAVERLGGLCLQVLISAQQTWARDGHSLSIDGVSDAFANQWNMFGAAALAADQGEAA